MSEKTKSIPEALGTHQPCPTQTTASQGEENERQLITGASRALTATVMEAPASEAKEKAEADEDWNQKIRPCPSIFDDAGNEQTPTPPSVGGNRLPVDSRRPSSGKKAKGVYKKDPMPASLTRATKPGAISAGAASAVASDMVAPRRKNPRPIRSPAIIPAGATTDGLRRKDPRSTGLSRGVPSPGTAAGWERQKDPRPTEISSGTASIDTAASWKRRKDPRPAVSKQTPDISVLSDDEPTHYQDSTDDPASQTTPSAIVFPSITSDSVAIENADPEPERAGQGPATDIASNVEAATNPLHATLQVPIGAHVVNERGQETGTATKTPTDELLREHIFADAPLISAEAVQNLSESPDADVTSRECSMKDYSRRTLLILALLVAIIVAAATLMGVLIPRGSTTASQEDIPGKQSSAALSSIPTTCPSPLPSLTPTFDSETLRFQSIQSVLVPISGLEALSNTSTSQYRALEWVSLLDPLRLPFKTEVERKRVVQRYVLAVLYYSCGGQHWRKSYHFLEGIHECDWWSFPVVSAKVYAQGAICTNGSEVGEVDHLEMRWNNLTGTLPTELQYLTGLKVAVFASNNIGGPIPGFNANMTSLEKLWLSGNSLTDSIPTSFGDLTSLKGQLSSLKKLWLYDNSLTGSIPKLFGSLTSLQDLSLQKNVLTGTIPSTLGQLSSLQKLWLYDNSLTGSIPQSFGKLTSLQVLTLDFNMLNGTIPSVLGHLSSLNILSLTENRFTGEIPNEICRRKESGVISFYVDSLTANGTEFLCECIPIEGLSGCCVVRPDAVGDSHCDVDEPYNMAACGWDGEDCLIEDLPQCLGADPFRIGDGSCDGDEPYNTEACAYDGGDCCESTCEGRKCGRNGYDCKDPTVVTCLDADGLEGCCVEYPIRIGDGYCHPYEPYYTEACKFDNGDCPEMCPDGTSPVAGKNMAACCVVQPGRVGDGECDDRYELYNTAACGWDGGDCCKETCMGWRGGGNGYDCKDPTYNQHG